MSDRLLNRGKKKKKERRNMYIRPYFLFPYFLLGPPVFAWDNFGKRSTLHAYKFIQICIYGYVYVCI